MDKTSSVGSSPLRIWRSPYSDFYREETLHAADVYTSEYLKELAGAGFNAVWIRGILRDLVPTKVFLELGRNSAAHLRSLRTVIRRGRRAGVRVFLYMQPPMGMPEGAAFWRRYPEAQGATVIHRGARMSAMCTSEPRVRAFLHEAAELLSKRLAGLGGVILITASEFQAHCYSHYPDSLEITFSTGTSREPLGCSRCRQRPPRDIIREIFENVRGGFRSAGSDAKIIAWNWSWSLYEKDPQNGIINSLPRDLTLMAGFERGAKKVILGKPRVIDEYALSYVGPSERFLASHKAARRRGMTVMTKLQIGTTHELATVPNLPLIGNLYEKARAIRRLRLGGFMGCWNFGNMLTANTAAFNRFLAAKRLLPRPQALAAFARDYFPGCDAKLVVEAWETFARAMDTYPFCIPFLYYSPLNYAVAQAIEPGPLDEKPVGRSWMPDRRGDELKDSFGPYALREIIRGLGTLTQAWWRGVACLERGLLGCKAPAAQEELNSVCMAGHCFRSGWNLYRAYRFRRKWSSSHLKPLRAIMCDEREHLADALHVAASDRRMGFHSECQRYLFTASGIRKKIGRLDELLRL